MNEFDKFNDIFNSSGPKKISPRNNVRNKRRSLPKSNRNDGSAQKSDMKRRRRSNQDFVQILGERSAVRRMSQSLFADSELEDEEEKVDVSTDKSEILPHLSCLVSDFDTTTKDVNQNNETDQDICTQIEMKRQKM